MFHLSKLFLVKNCLTFYFYDILHLQTPLNDFYYIDCIYLVYKPLSLEFHSSEFQNRNPYIQYKCTCRTLTMRSLKKELSVLFGLPPITLQRVNL